MFSDNRCYIVFRIDNSLYFLLFGKKIFASYISKG